MPVIGTANGIVGEVRLAVRMPPVGESLRDLLCRWRKRHPEIVLTISGEKLDIVRLSDEIFIEEIHRAGLHDEIRQAFAVILPVRPSARWATGAPMIAWWHCAP